VYYDILISKALRCSECYEEVANIIKRKLRMSDVLQRCFGDLTKKLLSWNLALEQLTPFSHCDRILACVGYRATQMQRALFF